MRKLWWDAAAGDAVDDDDDDHDDITDTSIPKLTINSTNESYYCTEPARWKKH